MFTGWACLVSYFRRVASISLVSCGTYVGNFDTLLGDAIGGRELHMVIANIASLFMIRLPWLIPVDYLRAHARKRF